MCKNCDGMARVAGGIGWVSIRLLLGVTKRDSALGPRSVTSLFQFGPGFESLNFLNLGNPLVLGYESLRSSYWRTEDFHSGL